MKKGFLMALCALMVWSCSKPGERLLTSATGTIYECLIVTPNGEVKEAVSETMGADMYGLPQMEATFVVTSVLPSQFDDFLKSTRNILYLDINPQKYTQVKALKSRDNWSKPQAYIRIQAPNEEARLKDREPLLHGVHRHATVARERLPPLDPVVSCVDVSLHEVDWIRFAVRVLRSAGPTPSERAHSAPPHKSASAPDGASAAA